MTTVHDKLAIKPPGGEGVLPAATENIEHRTPNAQHRTNGKTWIYLHSITIRRIALVALASAASLATACLSVSAAPNATASDTPVVPGWTVVAEAGSECVIAQDPTAPPEAQTTNSLRVTVKKSHGRAGIATMGTKRIKLAASQWYDLTFYARTEGNRHFGLVVSLESADGKRVCARATIPEVGGAWRKYVLALQVRQSNSRARLVIALPESGTIWLDGISLVSRKSAQDVLHAGDENAGSVKFVAGSSPENP